MTPSKARNSLDFWYWCNNEAARQYRRVGKPTTNYTSTHKHRRHPAPNTQKIRYRDDEGVVRVCARQRGGVERQPGAQHVWDCEALEILFVAGPQHNVACALDRQRIYLERVRQVAHAPLERRRRVLPQKHGLAKQEDWSWR